MAHENTAREPGILLILVNKWLTFHNVYCLITCSASPLNGRAQSPPLSWTERNRQQRSLENEKFLRRRDDFPEADAVGGSQWILRFAARRRILKCEATVPTLAFHTRSYSQFPWPSPSSRCLSATRARHILTFTAEFRSPWNTCKTLGGSRTSNSMHSCFAGRSTLDKRRPAGRKDVCYEICSFYVARQHHWRANGAARLKSLAEKGPNIKLNNRNGTHSSHSSCSLYCCTPNGLFQLERHSSFKMPCKYTDHMETMRPTAWAFGNY